MHVIRPLTDEEIRAWVSEKYGCSPDQIISIISAGYFEEIPAWRIMVRDTEPPRVRALWFVRTALWVLFPEMLPDGSLICSAETAVLQAIGVYTVKLWQQEREAYDQAGGSASVSSA